jgi:hypothetical protein
MRLNHHSFFFLFVIISYFYFSVTYGFQQYFCNYNINVIIQLSWLGLLMCVYDEASYLSFFMYVSSLYHVICILWHMCMWQLLDRLFNSSVSYTSVITSNFLYINIRFFFNIHYLTFLGMVYYVHDILCSAILVSIIKICVANTVFPLLFLILHSVLCIWFLMIFPSVQCRKFSSNLSM